LNTDPESQLKSTFSDAPYPDTEMGTTSPGSAVAGVVKLGMVEKWAVEAPDGADAVTSPPPAGSGGEVTRAVTEPVESAVATAGEPEGKETETCSPGTNPTPVYVVTSPAPTFTGSIEPSEVTVTGPGPTMPLDSPTPYRVWAPPANGEGTVTFVEGKAPLASAVIDARATPLGASRRIDTCSLGPNPPPWTETVLPGDAVPALTFQFTVLDGGVVVPPAIPSSSTVLTVTPICSPPVKWSGVSAGPSTPSTGFPFTDQA